jgi:hypothetical protein
MKAQSGDRFDRRVSRALAFRPPICNMWPIPYFLLRFVLMHYRIVYDVLNDSVPWFGVLLSIIPLLFCIACCLELVGRVRRRQVSGTPAVPRSLEAAPGSVVVISILILGFFGLFAARKTYEGFAQLRRCQDWVQTGQYCVTEGTIAECQYRKAGPRFHVADSTFDLLDRWAGFTGRFNVPGAAPVSLRDGLRVRLAHREGFILRVELAP